ncbi:unnamed protein product [Adineta ricciae]|uniref:Uncharacterized protein n=1 Tax=Adineta ricciae TaxID=249248 RepID=A0A815LR97_ADIRI|nr:unnamed protein product [Adineta ricciae]
MSNSDAEKESSCITAFSDDEGFTKSFSINETNELLDFFHKYGFVVIRDIVDSQSQIENTVDEIWNLLRVLNPKIDKNDSSTWEDANWPIQMGLKDGGFISHMSDVATKMCWENRQHPNIVKLFQILLQQDDLWVKFDRYGFMRPTKDIPFTNKDNNSITIEDRPEWRSKPNWLHWDQNPWKYPDFMGIQGLLALSDTNSNTGGFHCVPSFTHRFKQWSIDNEQAHRSRGGLVNVPSDDPIRNEVKQIHVRKGSFVAWDSRLPHGNFPNNNNQFRIVQYIAFEPAKENDERELTSRIDAFHMRRLCSKADEQLAGFPEPQLTELGEKIIGIRIARNDYDETIPPLLRRMLNLTKLNLCLTLGLFSQKIVDGNIIRRDIVSQLPKLKKFDFFIHSITFKQNEDTIPSIDDIQRTFIGFEKSSVQCHANYLPKSKQSHCHIYCKRCSMIYFNFITNHFHGGIFHSVRKISLLDEMPFENEFFRRIAQSFPMLEELSVINNEEQQQKKQVFISNNDLENSSPIKYPHLHELRLVRVPDDYVEQFLLNTKTCLEKKFILYVEYESLQRVTHGLTRDQTRMNCEKIIQLYLCYKGKSIIPVVQEFSLCAS